MFRWEEFMKKLLLCLFVFVLLFGVTGCGKEDDKLGGDTPLTNNTEKTITITAGNKSCIPVQLTLYDDGTYELFTTYKACKEGQLCNSILEYTKSLKGKYDYDVMKILDDDSIEIDKSHSMDNLPEYEIYMGNDYVKEGYGYYYSVEKGKTNKYLDEFLKSIEIDLNTCAEAEYID